MLKEQLKYPKKTNVLEKPGKSAHTRASLAKEMFNKLPSRPLLTPFPITTQKIPEGKREEQESLDLKRTLE
jgi:hypothetical protein